MGTRKGWMEKKEVDERVKQCSHMGYWYAYRYAKGEGVSSHQTSVEQGERRRGEGESWPWRRQTCLAEVQVPA